MLSFDNLISWKSPKAQVPFPPNSVQVVVVKKHALLPAMNTSHFLTLPLDLKCSECLRFLKWSRWRWPILPFDSLTTQEQGLLCFMITPSNHHWPLVKFRPFVFIMPHFLLPLMGSHFLNNVWMQQIQMRFWLSSQQHFCRHQPSSRQWSNPILEPKTNKVSFTLSHTIFFMPSFNACTTLSASLLEAGWKGAVGCVLFHFAWQIFETALL